MLMIILKMKYYNGNLYFSKYIRHIYKDIYKIFNCGYFLYRLNKLDQTSLEACFTLTSHTIVPLIVKMYLHDT